jgi:hypothetical protein
VTAFHNGVLIQNDATLAGETLYIGKPAFIDLPHPGVSDTSPTLRDVDGAEAKGVRRCRRRYEISSRATNAPSKEP